LKAEYNNVDGFPKGLYREYYPSGALKEEGQMSERWKMCGIWKYYYESGVLHMKGEYSKGSRAGLWSFYWENGTFKKDFLYD
jgi:antitoxin component YwqK of YwqJK toxin-antitoxin module